MLHTVSKPKELIIYELLQSRMEFTIENKMKYKHVLSGYQGERKFALNVLERIQANYIAMYDVLLDYNGALTQIDCFIFLPQKVLLLEVKNFRGEFMLQNEQFISLTTKNYYQNPLHQLRRAELNVQNIFQGMRVNIAIESFVVFVNPEFTLFTEKNDRIILPTQLNSFLGRLNQEKYSLTNMEIDLVNRLKSYHTAINPMERIPQYKFETLQKGITCGNCRNWMQRQGNSFICFSCSNKESINSAILRSANEFEMLFPNEKITSRKIRNWTGNSVSQKTISLIFDCYMQKINRGKKTNYIFRDRAD